MKYIKDHRAVRVMLAAYDLPRIDAVLITHDHYDHLRGRSYCQATVGTTLPKG